MAVSSPKASTALMASCSIGFCGRRSTKCIDHDRSAARGEMSKRRLIVFKHENRMGNTPAHELRDRVTAHRVYGGETLPVGDQRTRRMPCIQREVCRPGWKYCKTPRLLVPPDTPASSASVRHIEPSCAATAEGRIIRLFDSGRRKLCRKRCGAQLRSFTLGIAGVADVGETRR